MMSRYVDGIEGVAHGVVRVVKGGQTGTDGCGTCTGRLKLWHIGAVLRVVGGVDSPLKGKGRKSEIILILRKISFGLVQLIRDVSDLCLLLSGVHLCLLDPSLLVRQVVDISCIPIMLLVVS